MENDRETPIRIAVACGGTGGHIFPGLATAEALRDRGHEVTLWLAGRDVEALSVSDWDGSVERVKASGFPSGLSLSSIKTAFGLLGAVWRCWTLMGRSRPQVCLAMGSYASVGPVLAARLRGVPVVLHEANVVPGRAISFLSRWAKVVATGFQEAERYFPGCDVRYTGLPLRRAILSQVGSGRDAPDWYEEYDASVCTLLVMGGSQGAHVLNTVVSEAVVGLHRDGMAIQVVHLSGRADEAEVRERYQAAGVRASVHGFLGDMPGAYRVADLAVCRSGAASCAELSVYGVPAIFVPLPSARRDHQHANAEACCAAGGNTLLPQSEMTVKALQSLLKTRDSDPGHAGEGRPSIHADASDRLASVVVELSSRD